MMPTYRLLLFFGISVGVLSSTVFLMSVKNMHNLKECEILGKTKSKLVTIFTTFKETAQREHIQSNTVFNWASLGSDIQPLLFTNSSESDSHLVRLAIQHKWKVQPLTRTNQYGLPFFKDMYHSAAHITDSLFYGFCNGDILFDEGIVNTLSAVSVHLPKNKSALIVGTRINAPIKKATMKPLWGMKAVRQFALTYGKLFLSSSTDYFFIWQPRLYPWEIIKDVVISGPGYDSHIIDVSNRGPVIVIDTTATILALHQTGRDGDFSSELPVYAKKLRQDLGYVNEMYGKVTASQFYTIRDDKGKVQIEKKNLKFRGP